ncbi:MAG: hypothetical protein ACJAWL_002956 [Motiliproteus sp.]|jgi:hypothetical protein
MIEARMKTPHNIWVVYAETRQCGIDMLRAEWIARGAKREPDLFNDNRWCSAPRDYRIAEKGGDFPLEFRELELGKVHLYIS